MQDFVIVGAGVSGLLLALGLKSHLGITATVYEQAPSFDDGVGGAIGMYPNGLQVIRDISPQLLQRIRQAGKPFETRTWYRHDGTVVARAKEHYLCDFRNKQEESNLSSMGIRRWRLQKVLVDMCSEWGIPIVMNTRIEKISYQNDIVEITTLEGKVIKARFLFGCDGVKSAIRSSLFANESNPAYTGITCLMGSAPIADKSPIRGINFPSSKTTRAHACYYPANEDEIIFQIYFPTPERPETWKALTSTEATAECNELAEKLKQDGWHSMFIEPLLHANSVLRVGLRARKPIPQWHYPAENPRIVLLGDAAHPPVPYIGQGAMMAIEDVGILVLSLKHYCQSSSFRFDKLNEAIEKYETLRLPRTTKMLEFSSSLGQMQLMRSQASFLKTTMKEWSIWFSVLRHGTLPIMKNGSSYNYKKQFQAKL